MNNSWIWMEIGGLLALAVAFYASLVLDRDEGEDD